MPKAAAEFPAYSQGLVLITGETGSGKSTPGERGVPHLPDGAVNPVPGGEAPDQVDIRRPVLPGLSHKFFYSHILLPSTVFWTSVWNPTSSPGR